MNESECRHCGHPIRLHNAGTVSNPHEVWMDDRAPLEWRTVCPEVRRAHAPADRPAADTQGAKP